MYEDAIERSWWSDERTATWGRLDEATREVVSSYDDNGLIGSLSLHPSAPNPNGINAGISPDEWHVTLPYEEGRVDVKTIASLLSGELDAPITIRPRTDEWEPGFWLIIENAERSLSTDTDRGETDD
ncbi:hypothetical protein [Natrinema halophilum]|uniref:Uncharacterized protein n=1 Tax=Natrinema halophilum TaxID=1699371 RepID=A0A7D5KBL3_9EURY|nr:hypothetical protein [Natrinema halophilum]QLG47916.1 hypothetical protein HYG82_03170 [Natrinema halophilum]